MTTRNSLPLPVPRSLSRRSLTASLLFSFALLVCYSLPSAGDAAALYSGKKAEKPYALIAGTVWGPDSFPVPGVPVKIRRAGDKKARWELISDSRGEFAQRVPAGKAEYILWIDLKGYKGNGIKKLEPGPEITVEIENDERIDTGLHLK